MLKYLILWCVHWIWGTLFTSGERIKGDIRHGAFSLLSADKNDLILMINVPYLLQQVC